MYESWFYSKLRSGLKLKKKEATIEKNATWNGESVVGEVQNILMRRNH